MAGLLDQNFRYLQKRPVIAWYISITLFKVVPAVFYSILFSRSEHEPRGKQGASAMASIQSKHQYSCRFSNANTDAEPIRMSPESWS